MAKTTDVAHLGARSFARLRVLIKSRRGFIHQTEFKSHRWEQDWRLRARDGRGEAAHPVQRFLRSTSLSLSSGCWVLGLLLAPINVMPGFPAPGSA